MGQVRREEFGAEKLSTLHKVRVQVLGKAGARPSCLWVPRYTSLRQWAFSLEHAEPYMWRNICLKTPCVFTGAAYLVESLDQEFTQA